MATVLDAAFFARPALTVARDLLGMYLVRQLPGEQIALRIHETEAYVGPHDLACHAAKGRTPRTDVMFGPAGVWYVYFVYGIHWMLNVVTGNEGFPSAVLLRGAGAADGPAKLTKALAIDKRFNTLTAAEGSGLWIEDRGHPPARGTIRRTPRIGVDYAGPWAAKPYRFVCPPEVGPTSLRPSERPRERALHGEPEPDRNTAMPIRLAWIGLLTAVLAGATRPLPAAEVELFVASGGSDQNPGTREKPLASVPAALKKLGTIQRKPEETGNVVLRGGVYRLSEPIRIQPDDAGQGLVAIKTAAGERVVLSGGHRGEGVAERGRPLVDGRRARGQRFRMAAPADDRRRRAPHAGPDAECRRVLSWVVDHGRSHDHVSRRASEELGAARPG